ncbi:hypothetical protein BKK45_05085 [Bacillus cereus]|nr:hypothetical protein BKK45_05085 [Bacillus cereus]
MRMKLLLTGAFKYSEEQLKQLQLLGYEITFIQDERLPLQIDVSDIDAVVCNSLFLSNDINKFERLKFVQLTSAGLDRVPLSYIKDHGIVLHSAKGIYSIPMAEWVILKVLEIYKNSRGFYEAQFERRWEKCRDIIELTGKTATIIGFGDVGSEIAKRLKVFEVNIIGVGRREIDSDIIDEFYFIDEVEAALRKSDIVILTLPLTEETYHLIDKCKINKMKEKSILVNVSRGAIINEEALIEALRADKFLGVALDVFKEEPLPYNNDLWELDKVIVTPHNSFVSNKINERLFNLIMKNLKSMR